MITHQFTRSIGFTAIHLDLICLRDHIRQVEIWQHSSDAKTFLDLDFAKADVILVRLRNVDDVNVVAHGAKTNDVRS